MHMHVNGLGAGVMYATLSCLLQVVLVRHPIMMS